MAIHRAPKARRATTTFGELVATAFDQAMNVTADPRDAARLAGIAVARLLLIWGHGPLLTRLAGN